MGKSISLKCGCCGHEVKLEWGKGFYVSSDGRETCCDTEKASIHNCGEGGISGFWVDKICKNCGDVIRESRYIEDTTDEYMVAWMNFPRIDIIESCTSCSSKDILTMYEIISEDVEIPCMECKEGNMVVSSVI